MEQKSLTSNFLQLRLPHNLQQSTDRILTFRPPHSMDQLVNDFNTALDETAGSNGSTRSTVSRRKAWKRRCKSTSNLLLAGQNLSDDSSSSVDNVGLLSRDRGTSSLQFSDSDLEMGGEGFGEARSGRNRQSRLHEYRTKRFSAGADVPGVESDSFNENISPFKEFRANSKRKRHLKRTVDQSPENRKPKIISRSAGTQGGPHSGPTSIKRKKVRSRSGHLHSSSGGPSCESERGGTSTRSMVPVKRKRSGRSRTVSLGDEASNAGGMEKMELEEVRSSSSLSSSSECDDRHSDGSPEGEADDEQSDWPGPEPGLAVMQLTDESDPEISFSQLQTGPPRKALGRPFKSGTRRLKPNNVPGGGVPGGPSGPSPPVGLAYSDQVSRFIQDSSRTSLRLTAAREADRNMILNLAGLYSLSWSPEGPSLLVLTKTPEFAVPGIPASGARCNQQQLRERKSTDIKRQRRTPPLTVVGGLPATSITIPSKPERQSRHKTGGSASGSKSS